MTDRLSQKARERQALVLIAALNEERRAGGPLGNGMSPEEYAERLRQIYADCGIASIDLTEHGAKL